MEELASCIIILEWVQGDTGVARFRNHKFGIFEAKMAKFDQFSAKSKTHANLFLLENTDISMSSQTKMTKMTVDEVSKLIVNKRDLYEACQRNAYYLPRYKSSMITEEWLRAIIGG